MLETVTIHGLGMSKQQIKVNPPTQGGAGWRVHIDENTLEIHLKNHIVGKYFLNPITVDKTVWGSRLPVIGGSDVSQHRSAVPFPGRFFKRHAPFVLNNAAGTLRMEQYGRVKFDNIFNPRPDEEFAEMDAD